MILSARPNASELCGCKSAKLMFVIVFQLKQKSTQQGETHLRSSNLSHLEGILTAVETLPGLVEVLKPFPCPTSAHPLVVDLICNQGYTWVKVVARKAQALHFVWAGELFTH